MFRGWRFTALVSAVAIACAVPVVAQTAGDDGRPVSGGAAAKTSSPVYIVQMVEAPVVAYTGGIPGFRATKPARGGKIDPQDPNVVRYAAYLDSRHDQVLAKVRGTKVYDYKYAFHGFAARLTREEVAVIKADPGVVNVEKAQEVTMDTASTPAFLGLTDPATGLWTAPRNIKGEDVIIGIVDSGIWPESESFSDRTGTGPNDQADKLAYHQIPGWHGKCTPGEEFNASHCNQKLIGAQYFCESRGCDTVREGEFLSPRDFNGHGTHTASTAGGNQGVTATGAAAVFGTANGIAPRARIAAYKVCWDNGAGSCGANSGDSVAAIDQAVADGVDVINYSISGTSTNYLDAVEVAYLFAADAGVFVATSAGNSGPAVSTVAHISPWLSSVAAGTHNRSGDATITLGNGSTYVGASLTLGAGPAGVVLATASGVAGADPNLVRQCNSVDLAGKPVLDPAKVAGKIVVCERGGAAPNNARVDKSVAVKNAGGAGMILYNVAAASINADLHSLPTVHINNVDGAAVVGYVTTPGVSATATLTQAVVNNSAPAPDVAGFSSRGPSPAGLGDILKPDFMAPGQDILAAVAPPGNAGKDFDLYSGTSMSSPHVAGLGALLTEARRDWSPAAMRSALATTADATSRAGLGAPFNVGSGQVRPNRSVDPGLVYDAGFGDYVSFLKGQGLITNNVPVLDASDLNQPSLAVGDLAGSQVLRRRVTNVGATPATYVSTVVAPAGFNVSVSPSSLTLNAGATRDFQVTITRTTGPFNTYRFGSLTWSDATHAVRSPIVVRPVALAAPAALQFTGASGSASYGIKTGYDGALAYARRGLIPAATETRTVADDPTSNFNTGNPDGNQGIQVHDVIVPAGAALARFSLFDASTDGNHDLDLYVYVVNADASKTLVGISGGGTSTEQVTLPSPAAATYQVYVHGWETDGPDANYTLFSWVLGDSAVPNWTVTGPATATTGGAGTVNVTWTGLTTGEKYLGQVLYQEGATTHATTIVRVDP
jgi:subtilisin family serine protease